MVVGRQDVLATAQPIPPALAMLWYPASIGRLTP
jgi:hypothetical protein